MAAAATSAAAQRPFLLPEELRAQFSQQIDVMAIRMPKQSSNQYMKRLSKHLLNKPRLRNVMEDGNAEDSRLLLLDEALTAEADLEGREVAGAGGEPARSLAQFIRDEGLALARTQVAVDYSYWPAHTVLQRLLPPGVEVPSSFETVGHIAHLNLREELLPHKHTIGQVILDKNPRLRTVVNKVASIENEFRVFPQEVLAGEPSCETEVRQHGARFRLDYAKVYWNSRLEREHQRLVGLFRPGQVVLDAMAGIGPFAIPAAQKGCLVYANDLNPVSFEYLCTNIKLNRVGGKVLPFNADGRAFMRQAAAGALDAADAAAVVPPPPAKPGKGGKDKMPAGGQQQQAAEHQGQQPEEQMRQGQGAEQQEQQAEQQRPAADGAAQQPAAAAAAAAAGASSGGSSGSAVFQHVVMNLPAAAVEFLDALNGAFCPTLWAGQPLPLVHVYTFAKGEEELAGLRQRVEAHLGGPLDEEPQVHLVRDVAPKKLMVCVTFRVPPSIAFAGGGVGGSGSGGEDDGAKRQRTQ